MIKITEVCGHAFTVELKDGTAVTILAGESKVIKKSQVSDSLINAYARGRVILEELLEDKPDKATTTKNSKGGSDK